MGKMIFLYYTFCIKYALLDSCSVTSSDESYSIVQFESTCVFFDCPMICLNLTFAISLQIGHYLVKDGVSVTLHFTV